MSQDFLITWKPDGWPYSNLQQLVEKFEKAREAKEFWRFAAHRKVKVGDRIYLYKQGSAPRGVFGVGRSVGGAMRNPNAGPKQRDWQLPVVFDLIVDPYKEMLVADVELLKMLAPKNQWSNQSSGISLNADIARAIDARISARMLLAGSDSHSEPFHPRNIVDARERVNRAILMRRGQRGFRVALLNAYRGKCAITGCEISDILEAAHIVPYRGIDTNDVRNGILLRSDIHTLFDCGLLSIESRNMTVVLANRIRDTNYKALAGRKVRLPKLVSQQPSKDAIDAHHRTLRKN
jgi:putative restriction endonuclease